MGMNKLLLAKRVQILSMLCEGSSMRSISRVVDVSINTVTKLTKERPRFAPVALYLNPQPSLEPVRGSGYLRQDL
jgi:hypothetical protein